MERIVSIVVAIGKSYDPIKRGKYQPRDYKSSNENENVPTPFYVSR
jgi:hypothetical protein